MFAGTPESIMEGDKIIKTPTTTFIGCGDFPKPSQRFAFTNLQIYIATSYPFQEQGLLRLLHRMSGGKANETRLDSYRFCEFHFSVQKPTQPLFLPVFYFPKKGEGKFDGFIFVF
jgi:hypothetical protein